MKRLLFLLLLIATPALAFNQYGPIWKNLDGEASPGDAIESVNFTGISTVGLNGLPADATFDTISTTGAVQVGTTLDVNNLATFTTISTTSTIKGGGNLLVNGNAVIRGQVLIGTSIVASGDNAVATGNNTICSGVSCFASGDNVDVDAATAQGFGEDHNIFNTAESSFTTGKGHTITGGYGNVGGLNNYNEGLTSMVYGTYLRTESTADNSVMFGSYANSTERDANKMTAADTMQLTNMDLIVDGGITTHFEVYSSAASKTIDSTHYSFDCLPNDNAVTFNLPTAVGIAGKWYYFTIVDQTNKCFVNANGAETVNGLGNYSGLDTQFESIGIQSTGAGWRIKTSF